MKHPKYNFMVLAIAAIAIALVHPYSVHAAISLLLQQTPVQGGTVEPGIGLHQFELNTQVTLTAIPKSGYQFVYWLGDVEDPVSSTTIVYIDGPKIVIAVFERIANEFLVTEEEATSSPNEGLIGHPADYAMGTESAIGGKRPPHYRPPPEEPKDKDFPVPEPVPEPATIFLLVAGTFLAAKTKTRKQA
jgi:hypothetical protein